MLTDCPRCRATVDAEVKCDYTTDYGELPFWIRYILSRCPRCSTPLLLSQELYDEEQRSDSKRLYPQPEYQPGRQVPEEIREAFLEALTAYRAGAHTASAIMCRKTLEGVCESEGVKEGTLYASLEAMRDTGIIEDRLYEWADELRLVGNEAAHDVHVTVGQEDAKDAIQFTHAILEYLYTFRKAFQQFRERRRKAQE